MSQDSGKKWIRVVAKAWADEEYKRRLKEDPATVLKEEGIDIPANVKLRIIEDAPGTRTIILPPAPEAGVGAENLEERLAAMMFPPFGF